MKFTKMHGLGNDYVYVNGFEERVLDPAAVAVAVSDRHTGVGADGLIIILPSDQADVRMEMFNADGSRAEVCGNGLRCVAKFAFEHRLVPSTSMAIETDGGIKSACCRVVDGLVQDVRVDMGKPSLDPKDLPAAMDVARIVDHPLRVDSIEYAVTCVSMGNPHVVLFVDDVEAIELDRLGPQFERASVFPNGINTHFVRVDDRARVVMRTWERGSGATQACGTGACAVCVAGALTGRTDRMVTATLPGGDLAIEWAKDDHVYMTGPAIEVFTGDWPANR